MGLGIYLFFAFLLLAGAVFIFRVAVRRDYRKYGRLKPLSSFLELLIISLWVTFAYSYRTADWPATHVGPIVGIVGWTLFVGGMVTAFTVMAWFGLARAFGLESNELKQTGAYGLSRNPQAVAFLIAMIGHTMLWPSWTNLGSVLLLAIILHIMIVTEEEHLGGVFGDEYRRYCERVPRYLGWASSM